MAASRSTRVTRSTVGLNGLDENFCGRTLRNRSIAHPEEVSSLPQVRSRSPKKKPESVQTQKGNNSGRTNDGKQQNSRESWVSPRKRGLSTSEKESIEKQIVENFDKKQVETVSPVLKRIKRCLRSEVQNSSEEVLPSKTGKERLERKSSGSDNVAVTPGTKRACRCLILDYSDKREVKKVNACTERFNSSSVSEELLGCQTINGVDGRGSDDTKCDDCHPDGNATQNNTDSCSAKEKAVAENGNTLARSSFFLNRSKEDNFVDHSVPCTNSQEQLTLEDHKQLNNCLPEGITDQAHESGTGTGSFSEIQSSVLRDSEEEVDVVGDSSASKEQSENTNSNAGNCHDSASVSGEPEQPNSVLDCVSSQITSATESQEHRYTLRTSPWRVGPAKGSPTKHNSPCRGNGQLEENNHSAPEKDVESSIANINGSPMNTEIILKDKGCDSEDCINGQNKPPSEAKLVTGSLPSAKESANLHAVEDEEEEPDVYFFESDHVALKHNKDYQRLLQTIAVLEAQRTQAVQDLENLGRHQREALKDPIGFVESLQKKVDVGLPHPQRVVQLPEISWDQYTTSLGNFEREFKNRKRNSRRAKLIFDKVGLPARPKSPLDLRKDGEATSYSVLPFSDCPEVSTNNRPQVSVSKKQHTKNHN
ncbi:ZZ-type zinc finger-containing protein 3 isoform X1 [Varanus komodoensis]|uniref:ZZ-type zinc finger-containing protein 3 isoform X1 n=1 Tax=Varanus komodoensis TaxID=61221 RepID=UPI001CF7BD20|nr:ZZ-type zinc finger-containing protein 3 isoform X1 [Varanus komodoensis]XP_044288251.1 ZZ-type zinc finger-containing protein 3 isoform X1 [Varanus komodoensis]XP_044288252.1 ZZ-type zinc finger-containing protein 3 isoform X1 [Varanus komodoensis]XP_044288253.1 ZZ-type zinc finger-containing protein 3 isoform X1 [Varanus komodoensis]XP_044288254.1 ZZ-type zinc finger-containing protein 3 isoform X1 [Varanus komodoensis]XP_044288255.1 ZZ-type zinc finger-containing protein 3 isoform X1 [Va